MASKLVSIVRSKILEPVNAYTEISSERKVTLGQLQQQISFKAGEETDLRLSDPDRQLLLQGALRHREGHLHACLLDHVLLFTKPVKSKDREKLKVYRFPIPLELLHVSILNDSENSSPNVGERQFPMKFECFGRHSYILILSTTSRASQEEWLRTIQQQQLLIQQRTQIFQVVPISPARLERNEKVNCAAPYCNGEKVVYGADAGVYLLDLDMGKGGPFRILELEKVTYLDVIEDLNLLVVLFDRKVMTFSLDPRNEYSGETLGTNVTHLKVGLCLDRRMICAVKASAISSTFKVWEATKGTGSVNGTVKLFRDFYIPTEPYSIHFLKSKMCIACSNGFEIVDLQSLDTQALLDPRDPYLHFMTIRPEKFRAKAVFRLENDFLLCYDAFAFFVDRSGKMTHNNLIIRWDGSPTGFAFSEPYILAIDPSFIEVRYIHTGALRQIIRASSGLRLLFEDNPPSCVDAQSRYRRREQTLFFSEQGVLRLELS